MLAACSLCPFTAMSGQGVALADSGAAELPPTWHIHDGRLELGLQHKAISFFARSTRRMMALQILQGERKAREP